MFNFLSSMQEQLSLGQTILFIILWLLSASLLMIFSDPIVNFICKLIKRFFKHDKN